MTESNRPRSQLRQPRLAEIVANSLRERILRGDIEDQTELPKQEELFEEFGVSMPSIREALRILETEGLITVRRGNRGGAVVHQPKVLNAGYMFGLVLQTRKVALADLGMAIRQIDPMCAGMCAERPDRAESVLPALERAQAAAEEAVDDFATFVEAMKSFHEEMVRCCGNETIILIIGTLESIWYAHEREWASRAIHEDGAPEQEVRERGLAEHRELIAAIAAGEATRSVALARAHQEHGQPYAVFGAPGSEEEEVDAQSLFAEH